MALTRRSQRTKSKKGKERKLNQDSDDTESDPLEELTRPQLLEINSVFDESISYKINSSKNLTASSAILAGGFVDDQDQDDAGGGFIVDQDETEPGGFLTDDDNGDHDLVNNPSWSKDPNRMSLRHVPDALKRLNLPYRDSDILEVFDNAASSDEESSPRRKTGSDTDKQKWISRIKFSQICAVLITSGKRINDTNSEPDHDNNQSLNDTRTSKKRASGKTDHDYNSDDTDQASSDSSDYRPDKKTTKSQQRITRQTTNIDSDQISPSSKNDNRLTRGNKKLQKQEISRGKQKKLQQQQQLEDTDQDLDDDQQDDIRTSIIETFSLFFHETDLVDVDLDVSNRTIGPEEIKLAANKLGEKLTDEEIDEMLKYASSSGTANNNNNSTRVSLNKFEKLMYDIKTV